MKLTSWSFSTWSDYNKCPRLVKYKKIDKIKEPSSTALERGNRIHQLAQDYIESKIQVLPSELSQHATTIQALREQQAVCEQAWGFTSTWEPTGWVGEDVWLRVKMDAFTIQESKMMVFDWKTGREYPEHRKQLSLYALSSFVRFPEVQEICAQDHYLDSGAVSSEHYTRDEFDVMMEVWMDRATTMMSDDTFDPKPNPKCKWCHFRASNGGPCEHG